MMAKKKDKSADTGRPLGEKIRDSWEYRSGKFVLRIVAALFFLSYLSAAAPMAWTWAWSAYYKNQPPSALDRLIEKNLLAPNQTELLTWIKLRPALERTIIMEKLSPHTALLDPFFFLLYSHWSAEALEAEDIVFWHMYARYRFRYDALRCGAPDSVANMQGILELMPNAYIDAMLERWPYLLKPSLQRVLDYDAEYPAANNPARICEVIYNIEGRRYKMVSQKYWASIRHTLRMQTEFELDRMDESGRALSPKQESPAPEDTDGKEAE